MALHLYDTMARAKRAFVPIDARRVTMYVCGPTVYAYAHIGNARPVAAFDVLFRLLRRAYGAEHVVYARNFTDVDDKIIEAARTSGEPIEAITERFARIYLEDAAALGALPASATPRATEHMDEMVAVMQRLVAGRHAYAAQGHVLFNVPSYRDYGALSNRAREDMIAGARVEVAPYKKDPADFVLWKPAKPDEPAWDSPWGRGRPGWHLECSAMIEATLGRTIDIHGGGQDLQFPHHENEIAQSRCANAGAPLANYWLHNGFVTMAAEKMSKSLGNVSLVHDLLKTFPGEVLRYALLSAHYRQPLDWTDALLAQSRAVLDGWYGALRRLADVDASGVEGRVGEVRAALEDDLNTPGAYAVMSGLASAANKASSGQDQAQAKADLVAGGALLGFLHADPEAWFKSGGARDGLSDAEIDALAADNQRARADKDWAAADAIRDQLTAAGVVLEMGPDGVRWRRSS